MPDLVKIGFTNRDPITRSKELSSHTGVPGKFSIEKSWEVLGAEAIEAVIFEELSTLRLEGREFFRFSAPEKAINRVSSILTQLGELDANGETVPTKERLAKYEKERKKEQERLARIKVANRVWISQREKNEELALSKVERRLGYSKALAKRELQEFETKFDRLEQRTVFIWPLAVIIPIFWPFVLIRFFILKYYKKKLTKHSSKVDVVDHEVYKQMSHMEDGP
jgi:hypothetical protein